MNMYENIFIDKKTVHFTLAVLEIRFPIAAPKADHVPISTRAAMFLSILHIGFLCKISFHNSDHSYYIRSLPPQYLVYINTKKHYHLNE